MQAQGAGRNRLAPFLFRGMACPDGAPPSFGDWAVNMGK